MIRTPKMSLLSVDGTNITDIVSDDTRKYVYCMKSEKHNKKMSLENEILNSLKSSLDNDIYFTNNQSNIQCILSDYNLVKESARILSLVSDRETYENYVNVILKMMNYYSLYENIFLWKMSINDIENNKVNSYSNNDNFNETHNVNIEKAMMYHILYNWAQQNPESVFIYVLNNNEILDIKLIQNILYNYHMWKKNQKHPPNSMNKSLEEYNDAFLRYKIDILKTFMCEWKHKSLARLELGVPNYRIYSNQMICNITSSSEKYNQVKFEHNKKRKKF